MRTETRAHLGQLGSAWDALVDQMPVPSPFLRSWWLEATAGPQPVFVLVFSGSDLVGGLALEEDRWMGIRRFRVMGHGSLCPDHLDLVAAPCDLDAVGAELRAWFREEGRYVVDLSGVCDSARVIGALPNPIHEDVVAVAPWAPLPATFDDFLAPKSRQFRRWVRRPRRRLEAEDVRHVVVGRDGCDRAVEVLRALHTSRWGERSAFLPAFDRFASAARAGAERGEIVFHELVHGENVVAVTAWFEVAGRLSGYQAGRDPDKRWDGAGSTLVGYAIERGCDRGFTEVDLLRGDEAYKLKWATETRRLLRIRAGRGIVARTALLADRLLASLRRTASRVRSRWKRRSRRP